MLAYAQPYQWSCSPLDTHNDRYYLPDLPLVDEESLLTHYDNLFIYLIEAAFIFPVPMVNCSETVSAIRYCYFALLGFSGMKVDVFTLQLWKGLVPD